jgi:hypothetical protein
VEFTRQRTNKKEFIGVYWELHGCSTGVPPEFNEQSSPNNPKESFWTVPRLMLPLIDRELVGAAFPTLALATAFGFQY